VAKKVIMVNAKGEEGAEVDPGQADRVAREAERRIRAADRKNS
jgi:hypothetical protein